MLGASPGCESGDFTWPGDRPAQAAARRELRPRAPRRWPRRRAGSRRSPPGPRVWRPCRAPPCAAQAAAPCTPHSTWRDPCTSLGKLVDLAVGVARLAPLLGSELGPLLHAILHASLRGRTHLRIPLGDAAPLALALGFDLVPFRRERREDIALLLRELGPRGILLVLRLGGQSGRRRQRERQRGGALRGEAQRDAQRGERIRGRPVQLEPCRLSHASKSLSR